VSGGIVFDLWMLGIAAGIALVILTVRLVRWWKRPQDPWKTFNGREW
jgi:hypothetical protein